VKSLLKALAPPTPQAVGRQASLPTKGKDPPGVSLTGLSHRRVETKLLSQTIAQQAEHRPVERSD